MSHVKVVLWYGATSRTRSRVNVEKAGMLQGIRYILVGCFKPGLRVGYVTFFHLNTQDDEQQYAYDYQPTNPPAHHHIVRCLPLVFRWSGYEELACAHY